MKTWFKNWKHGRGLEIEAELKASRPTPSSHLVKSIVARVNPRPANLVRTRSRIAIAGVATAVMVAAVGASGGFSAAASGIAGAARSVSQSTHATSPGPVPGAPGPGHTQRGASSPAAAAQYHLAPTITGFSPSQGAPGSTVNVTGTNYTGLNQVTNVELNGEDASFTVTSATTLTFTVPSDGSTGPITVQNGTAPDAVSSDDFTVLTAPTNLSANPANGGAGSSVELDADSGLLGTTSVKIGGKAATFTVVSDTEIQTSVPSGAKLGLGVAQVTNPAGSATTPFTVDGFAPTLTGFTPSSGVADGSVEITVKGTNLDTATDLFFSDGSGGTVDAAVIGTPTKTAAQFDVPTGAHTGPVTVANATGQATSKASFIVIGRATVTSFSPTFGKVGTKVTITGTSFTGATGVVFGIVGASKFTVKGDTQITVTVPTGASGPSAITVSNANGAGPSSTDGFDVLTAAPDPTSAAPGTGGAGTSVAIGGSNFTGASKVTFNGKAASYTVTDDTHLTAIVPVGAPTTGSGIVVTNAVGSSAPLAFTVLSTAPSIMSFSPTSGAENDVITIKGTNLGTVTEVDFGAGTASQPFATQSATQITVAVPSGATTAPLTAKNPSGQGTSKATFTAVGTPVIVGFSPAYAKSPGTKLTIVGTHFAGAFEVDFAGGVSAKPTLNKDGSLSVVVPKNAANGVITVKVKSGAGTVLQNDSGSSVLTIVTKPTPGLGSDTTVAHGATLHLVGSGFIGVTGVKLGKTSLAFHVTDDGHMTVTIPSNATVGPKNSITIGNAAGTGTWKFAIT